MGGRLILETTFLVDLEREARRSAPGPAHGVLASRTDDRLYITPTIAGEVAVGVRMTERETWERFLAPFHVLTMSRDVCWEYGRIWRHLRQNGQSIGTNDLWIAAAAIAYRMALVTRNARHFARVPDLEVIGY